MSNGELDSIAPISRRSAPALDLPGVLPAPVALDGAQFKGGYHAGGRSFDIERLASSPRPQFALEAERRGAAGRPGQSPGLMAQRQLGAASRCAA